MDNKVVTAKAENVFSADILIQNPVNFALTADGLAKDRIESITTNATAQGASAKLNAIALMGTASGTQTMAVNIANTQLDTIDSHGSVLVGHAHDRKGADLWIDVNASFARLVTILQVPMSTATEVMSQALPWEAWLCLR